MAGQAFVTVATQDEYAIGGVVLGESLRRTCTSAELVILITEDVSLYARQLLSDVYDHVYLTTELCSHDDVTLSLLGRPELGVTFTKLHCWRLTQYRKCVFLDADTLVLQSCDELFERDELSAVPDTGWPDCFNSGVFVFRPSLETYARLVTLATSKGSFDGGDQGLLNTYFGEWRKDMSKRLPFVYNVVATTSYTYAPAYKHHSSGIKIVHFLGSEKPWSVPWFTDSGNVRLHHQHPLDMQVPVMQMWMGLFREKVLPKLPNIAQEEVKGQTEMTVSFLLQVIVGGKTRQYETPQQWMQWQQADHLLQEYFPAQAQQLVEHGQAQPPVHISHDERHRSPPQDGNHQTEKTVHHYDAHHEQHQHHEHHQDHLQEHHQDHHQEHHQEHQEHHQDHQGHHQEQHQEHHQEEHHNHEEQHHQHGQEQHQDQHNHDQAHHHWESKSQHESYQSQQDYQDHHWESTSQRENTSVQHQESHQIQPEYQEPADPHWEALLWHQIQNPWEPPSPPDTDIYPPDLPYQKPDEPKEPTFGWFGSSDGGGGGATSVVSASPSAGDNSVHQPPSSTDTIQPQLDNVTFPENENDDDVDEASSLATSQPLETEEESFQRMKSWEEGHIDYMGKDNFDNIWKRLESMFRVEEPEVVEDEDDDREVKTDIQEAISEAAEIASEVTEYFSTVSHFEGSQPESVYVDAHAEVASILASEASLPYPEGDFSGMVEWQEGRIDYSGKDRSDNIIKRLDMIFSGKLVLNN